MPTSLEVRNSASTSKNFQLSSSITKLYVSEDNGIQSVHLHPNKDVKYEIPQSIGSLSKALVFDVIAEDGAKKRITLPEEAMAFCVGDCSESVNQARFIMSPRTCASIEAL
jgi:hypothetical protein